MHIQQFIKKIPSKILERGQDYYHDNAITELNQNSRGTWIAEVEGNYDDYVVEIETNQRGEIEDYYCNCPYEGPICKHIAAVALKIEEEGLMTKATNGKESTRESSWQQLIKKSGADELRQFIIDYATRDKNLRHEIKLRFAKPKSGSQKKNLDFYRSQVAMCFNQYERHGFIDYNSTFDAIRAVNDFLIKAENYLKKGYYMEAFYIAAAIASEGCKAIQYMDDSAGQCGAAIYDAFDMIEMILSENNSHELDENIFHWLHEQVKNPDYNNYGIGDQLEPLYFITAIKFNKFIDAHELIRNKLKELKSADNWIKNYYTAEYLQYKMKLLAAEGRKEEAQQIVEENINLNEFRKIKVKQLLDDKNFNEAEEYIREGIEQSRRGKYPGLVIDWHKQLLELYNLTKDKSQQLEETRWLFKNDNRNQNEHLKNLKKLIAKNDWPAERDELISWARKNDEHYLFNIYESEGMKAELFALLKKKPSFHQLQHYENLLIDDYTTEMLELYRISLNHIAEISNSRNQYQDFARNLKRVKQLPGGKELVEELLANYRIEYKRRRAMIEELSAV